METKYTKSEWKIEAKVCDTETVYRMVNASGFRMSKEASEANAKLIAAAPEMHCFLQQELINLIAKDVLSHTKEESIRYQKIVTLINKATK